MEKAVEKAVENSKTPKITKKREKRNRKRKKYQKRIKKKNKDKRNLVMLSLARVRERDAERERETMRLADLLNAFHKGQRLIVVKITHNTTTHKEAIETITIDAGNADTLTYAEKYESVVMMFECPEANTLKVWTYRETTEK